MCRLHQNSQVYQTFCDVVVPAISVFCFRLFGELESWEDFVLWTVQQPSCILQIAKSNLCQAYNYGSAKQNYLHYNQVCISVVSSAKVCIDFHEIWKMWGWGTLWSWDRIAFTLIDWLIDFRFTVPAVRSCLFLRTLGHSIATFKHNPKPSSSPFQVVVRFQTCYTSASDASVLDVRTSSTLASEALV